MKNSFHIFLLFIALPLSFGYTKDFTVDFNTSCIDSCVPRMLFAFNAREQVERYNMQIMRNGFGVKRPDDPQGCQRDA